MFPMYHPAAALHNPALRPVILGDFARLPALINDVMPVMEPAPEPDQEEAPATKQLSMFERSATSPFFCA